MLHASTVYAPEYAEVYALLLRAKRPDQAVISEASFASHAVIAARISSM